VVGGEGGASLSLSLSLLLLLDADGEGGTGAMLPPSSPWSLLPRGLRPLFGWGRVNAGGQVRVCMCVCGGGRIEGRNIHTRNA
jgi:hypothetical protein